MVAAYTENDFQHVAHSPIHVERDSRPSPGAVAQPVPALADRDLLRRQDDADRVFRVLGIPVAGAQAALALPRVDW